MVSRPLLALGTSLFPHGKVPSHILTEAAAFPGLCCCADNSEGVAPVVMGHHVGDVLKVARLSCCDSCSSTCLSCGVYACHCCVKR